MPALVFKPELDDRWGKAQITSRNGVSATAWPIKNSRQILKWTDLHDFKIIVIDEAQFFDKEIVGVVQTLADKDKKVFISGLDSDYRRKPFGPMGDLLAIADSVTKLEAVCHGCLGPAIYTQRLVDGIPASFSGPTVQVGSDEYEARCRDCFEPG